jgi:hypothetical protein
MAHRTTAVRPYLRMSFLWKKQWGQNPSPDQIRLLLTTCLVLRDIEPHLKDAASGHAIAHNDGAKHGFVVPWNTRIDVRVDVYARSRKAKLLQNLRIDTL